MNEEKHWLCLQYYCSNTDSALSTAGSLIMAAYSQGEDVTESDTNKVFLHLFIWTYVMLIIFAILCSLGFYQLYML